MRREQANDVVRGVVQGVRALKDTWGKVTVLTPDGKTIDVMGDVSGRRKGESVEARGRLTTSAQYGVQLRASTIDAIVAETTDGVVAWLAAEITGFGPKRAAELVAALGSPEAVWQALEHDPAKLCGAVKGVTMDAARKAAAAYQGVKHERQEGILLRQWGLTDGQIKRVRSTWGKDAIKRIKDNPYQLAEEVHGFGFLRSDDVAQRVGIPREAPERIQAGMLHCLREARLNGHCWLASGELVNVAAELLALTPRQLWAELPNICDGVRAKKRGERIYLASIDLAEGTCATTLVWMLAATSEDEADHAEPTTVDDDGRGALTAEEEHESADLDVSFDFGGDDIPWPTDMDAPGGSQ